MKSVFFIRNIRNAENVVHETEEYNFVIPPTVVLIFENVEYRISRTYFYLIDNKIYYLVRKLSDTLL